MYTTVVIPIVRPFNQVPITTIHDLDIDAAGCVGCYQLVDTDVLLTLLFGKNLLYIVLAVGLDFIFNLRLDLGVNVRLDLDA